MEDVDNQINGFVHVVDLTGFGMSHLTLFTPSEAVRIGKNMEVSCLDLANSRFRFDIC